jgi:hypothetical protein
VEMVPVPIRVDELRLGRAAVGWLHLRVDRRAQFKHIYICI